MTVGAVPRGDVVATVTRRLSGNVCSGDWSKGTGSVNTFWHPVPQWRSWRLEQEKVLTF
jgi:hypothetical protein